MYNQCSQQVLPNLSIPKKLLISDGNFSWLDFPGVNEIHAQNVGIGNTTVEDVHEIVYGTQHFVKITCCCKDEIGMADIYPF